MCEREMMMAMRGREGGRLTTEIVSELRRRKSLLCQAKGAQPPTVACKIGSSVGTRYTSRTLFFARLGADSNARSVLVNKSFCVGAQSEVCQECVVGWVGRKEEVEVDF